MSLQSFEEGEKKPIAIGPWGGQDGSPWDDGVYSTIRELVIIHGAGIDSIQFEYDKKGTSIWSEKHGGNGGQRIDKIKLDYPDEFLTSVHGYYGSLNEWGPVFVRSLTFESNKRAYGPFGFEQGTYFSFPMTGGKIVGFHGRSGWYLDAIGIYLKPLKEHKTSKVLVQSESYINGGADNIGYSLMHGSVGNDYDIVVAVRPKEGYGTPQFSRLSTQISEEPIKTGNSEQAVSIERLPSKADCVLTYGPWGGSGGCAFDDGTFTGIRQILLSRNLAIVSMKVQYDCEGMAIWGSKHGGHGGFKADRIIFDYPHEILTHITGTYGPLMYMGPNVIKSLTFYTNKGKHGPFGEEQGPSFNNKMNEGKIVGFLGREGFFLDAIGVHVMEGKLKPARHYLSDAIVKSKADLAEIENPPWSNRLALARSGQGEEVACGVIKEPAQSGPGPWGGNAGKLWDDGVFSGIRQIFVIRSAEAICSIQIEYDRNGQSVWSAKHGGNGGTNTHKVKLEYPHEVLTCITGYYGPISRDERPTVVRSLTFYTSRGKYGPFGEEIGLFFTSTTTEGKVVGFHGRSSAYLDAIGVHMQHWLGSNKTSRLSRFKIFS